MISNNKLMIELGNEDLLNINGEVLPVIGAYAIIKGICLIGGSALAGAATGYALYELFS